MSSEPGQNHALAEDLGDYDHSTMFKLIDR